MVSGELPAADPTTSRMGRDGYASVPASYLLHAVRAAVRKAISPDAFVYSGDEALAGVASALDQVIAVITTIAWIVVLVSAVTLLNTLMLSVLDRRREIGVRAVIIGSEVHGAEEFLKGPLGVSLLEIGLAEVIVSLGKTGIDLNRVQILDGGLAVLAFGRILLAAVQILLLAHIGIARTGCQQTREDAARQQQTYGNRTTHIAFSDCRSWRRAKASSARILHDTARSPAQTVTGVTGCKLKAGKPPQRGM